MIGLCAEHAGDPASVEYLVSLGLDSLSCSPRRVPLIRFGVGHATLMRATVLPSLAAGSAVKLRRHGGWHELAGKLVRDRIPEIIQRAGLIPVIETASPQDYGRYVRAKLDEEFAEYLSSGDVSELADLVEVCFAAAALHGVGPDELLAIARDKRQQRGGFDDRLVWLGNLSGDHEPPTES